MNESQRVEALARMYIGAYNEPDAVTKRRMLVESFDEGGEYISENQILDFNGVLDMASTFHSQALMEIDGDVSVHHGLATFRWRFTETTSGNVTTGLDFCEVGPSGRLTKVVVFFDPA